MQSTVLAKSPPKHGDAEAFHSLDDKPVEGSNDMSTSQKKKRVRLCDDVCCGHCETSRQPASFVTPSTRGTNGDGKRMTPQDVDSLLWKEAQYRSTAMTKRKDYLSWDDYFMAVASLSAMRSKDPHHPSGCCLVDSHNRILGIGYNGFPMGCHDDCLPWKNDGDNWLHTKTPFCVHAKVNAILNKSSADLSGSRLYAKTFPCHECTKVIVQSRVAEVVYVEEQSEESDSVKASRIILRMAGVRMRQYTPNQSSVELAFPTEEVTERSPKSEDDKDDSNSEKVSKEALEHRDLLVQEAGYDPTQQPSGKRHNVLSWDDYFMSLASLTAMRSKDPNTQVGACLVVDRRVVGAGYNGFPTGCSDDALPWARSGDRELHKKYLYVCHAEVNAILNKNSASVRGATLYVAMFPCNECAKLLVQSGIAEVVYLNDPYHHTDACRASRILLQMAGVRLRKHVPSFQRLTVDVV